MSGRNPVSAGGNIASSGGPAETLSSRLSNEQIARWADRIPDGQTSSPPRSPGPTELHWWTRSGYDFASEWTG